MNHMKNRHHKLFLEFFFPAHGWSVGPHTRVHSPVPRVGLKFRACGLCTPDLTCIAVIGWEFWVSRQTRCTPDVQRKMFIIILITSSYSNCVPLGVIAWCVPRGRGGGNFFLGDRMGKFRCDHRLENLAGKILYSRNSQMCFFFYFKQRATCYVLLTQYTQSTQLYFIVKSVLLYKRYFFKHKGSSWGEKV